MAIALFNDQDVLAGQKLGISTAKAIALMIMASGLGAMNIYHMGNSITNKLLSPDSSLLLYALLYFIAACIAFIEVPITEEIVTKEARGHRATGHRLILAVVACMAMGGGVYSITTDAYKSDATRTAHTTNESGFEDLKQGLISDRNAARSTAKSSAERSQANSHYFKALAALKQQQANHQSTRPPETVTTGSFWHWLWACGFSFLCSIGVIVITAYLAKYHKPLTEIPRVFFRVKEDQEWQMNDDDVRVIPAQVDLSGGSSTRTARKALVESSQNRPPLDKSRVGAVLGHSGGASDRTLNETEKGGKVDYSEAHYQAIKSAVLNGDIKPTQRPIRAQLMKLNVRFVDDGARARKAAEILDTLSTENILVVNPEFNQGGKVVAKYLLNPDHGKPTSMYNQMLEEETVGEFDISTRCGHCGDYAYTRIDELIDQKNGVVNCESCDKNYMAFSHLTSDSNPLTDNFKQRAVQSRKATAAVI